jgi:hypothetical protein
MDFVYQLVMVQNFRSLAYANYDLSIYKFSKLEGEVQRGSEISCVEYKRVSLQSYECYPLILSVITSPSHRLASCPRKLALPCSGASKKCETLEKQCRTLVNLQYCN